MSPNDDLARWGEPPASAAELALAGLLADVLESKLADRPVPGESLLQTRATPAGQELLEASDWLELLTTTVLYHAGLAGNLPDAADAGGPAKEAAVDLRVRVHRLAGPGRHVLVGSTHPVPTTVRDMRRVPDDPDRVTLRTGDEVRVEVVCDRAGYLTVFNVGPQGALNLLWPADPAQASVQPAQVPLQVASVVLTPPAGQERLYAVWSRVPLPRERLAGLTREGVTMRDMVRVQEAVEELRPEDWQAVLLVLEHRAT
jgi:hypothetical protein